MTNTGFVPPDTVGDVGPNHYIQMVNSAFQIFNKQGTSLAGPTAINQLWVNANPPVNQPNCTNNNNGDPIVLYDPLADRWMMSQFAVPTGFANPPTWQCIAISRTNNPVTGGWHLYEFQFNFGHDYPKMAVWPDGYYLSSQRGFSGGALNAIVFDRANMLNGNPATFQNFTLAQPALVILPSDLDGPPPPAGTPAFFARHVDGDLWGGADRVEVYALTTNWGVPANSTFNQVATLPVAAFSSDICAGQNLFNNCVPQPGMGSPLLETLPHWPMWRLQFRNFGTYEAMVFNHTVDVDGNGHAGIRWYELRRPTGGAWTVFQQGTFSPDAGMTGLADDVHRWMGSIAMDRAGNMALGYSASDTNTNPEIRYAGRMATDPLGLLPHGEITLITGNSAQNGTRWGDYSSMNVDPVDDCTFWYTNEYMGAGGAWRTRIGAFRFPSCAQANQVDLSITKTDVPDPVFAGQDLTYTIAVTNNGSIPATNVRVTDTLPNGVQHLANTGGCTQMGQTLTCVRPTLNAGETWTFTITVKVNSNYVVMTNGAGTLSNTAIVTADQPDPDMTNNSATATTTVRESADLRVGKQCKPDIPAPTGSTATCTITVENLGPSDARDVVLTDVLVSNGSFTISSVTVSPAMSGTCMFPAGPQMGTATITCNLGVEPAGGTTTITVSFTSASAVDVNDTATVTSATPDPNPENNRATGKVSFTGSADLAITKTDAPDPVIAGTDLTYTITVSNLSATAAPNVVMTDVLPNNVTLKSAMPSQGSCGGPAMPPTPGQPLTCNLGAVAMGAPVTVTVVVTVAASTPNSTVLVNDASVASDFPDPNNANNRVTATTTVNTQADLVIDKTSDLATYRPSSVITWTVKVTNNGPSDALAVVVTDTLPSTRQAQYLSDTGGCRLQGQSQNQRLVCEVGTLKPGESKEFDIKMTVRGSRGNVTNAVSVTSSTQDLNNGNNTDSHTVTIQGGG